ncbi:MAG: NigD-like protein [Parabacteroides sp.]
MKKMKNSMLMCGIILCFLSFFSCLGDDDGYSLDKMSVGIVTIKPLSDNSYYLQLDDSTTIMPVNSYIPSNLKERRAIAYFTLLSDEISGYSHAAQIIRMDSVLTKSIAEDLSNQNDSIYGTDPIRLNTYSAWSKSGVWIEDGYLNIDFITEFGGYKKHFLNLIHKTGSNDPYELEFRHNANGDMVSRELSSIVAFKLNKLPSTDKKTVKLTLHYMTQNGDKTIELNYKSKD